MIELAQSFGKRTTLDYLLVVFFNVFYMLNLSLAYQEEYDGPVYGETANKKNALGFSAAWSQGANCWDKKSAVERFFYADKPKLTNQVSGSLQGFFHSFRFFSASSGKEGLTSTSTLDGLGQFPHNAAGIELSIRNQLITERNR